MNRWKQTALITAACCGTYFIMRSLPVEPCEFLHYGDFINDEGVIEGCGYEETAFFDMEEIRFAVIPQIRLLNDPAPGQPLEVDLTLTTSTGKPIRWEEIAVSHTERIHAMVVDPSLTDYQHLHPQPAGGPGHYRFEFTPKNPGTYQIYLDLIPLTNSRRTLLHTSLSVPGQPATPQLAQSFQYQTDDLRFRFLPQQENQLAGEEITFRLEVEHANGQPTVFSPVMDSYAHVVAFDPRRAGFAHLHPLNPFLTGQDPANPDLQFAFQFDQPGAYRVWAQVVINGREIFAPFDIQVDPLKS